MRAGLALILALAATSVAAGASFRDCATCPEMVPIPAGSFSMGSARDSRTPTDEQPVRSVSLERSFSASRFEITIAQFAEFVSTTGREIEPGCLVWERGILGHEPTASWRAPGFEQGDQSPVTCVTWVDAVDYTRWLSRKTGLPYRLLTEAEWEYAARSGRGTRFPSGARARGLCRHGNVADLAVADELGGLQKVRAKSRDNGAPRPDTVDLDGRFSVGPTSRRVPWTIARCRDGFGLRTAPVGSFPPNRFGLHDTTGNVWEWVQDCFREGYGSAPVDGAAVDAADCRLRVLRGGAWAMNTDGWRLADRDRDRPDVRYAVVGFRVAR